MMQKLQTAVQHIVVHADTLSIPWNDSHLNALRRLCWILGSSLVVNLVSGLQPAPNNRKLCNHISLCGRCRHRNTTRRRRQRTYNNVLQHSILSSIHRLRNERTAAGTWSVCDKPIGYARSVIIICIVACATDNKDPALATHTVINTLKIKRIVDVLRKDRIAFALPRGISLCSSQPIVPTCIRRMTPITHNG